MHSNYGILRKIETTKHKSLVFQSFCRPAYIPKKHSRSHVRKVFDKYLQGKEKSMEKEWIQHKDEKNLNFFNCLTENSPEKNLNKAFVIRIRSPCIKIRKSRSKDCKSAANSSLLIQRAKMYENYGKFRGNRSRLAPRGENSNYMSYSDIYQSILRNL
jgi:hypothetical protein